MKWVKLTLKTLAEAVELVSNMLSELGIEGVEVIDNVPITEEEKKAMFIDVLPELDTSDKTALVTFYLNEQDDTYEMIHNIKEGLEELSAFIDVGEGSIEVSETEDVDWINNWKAYFKPFRVDDTIVIKPTWEVLTEQREDDLVIEIDPGTSFGTGSHETTKLCILGLKKHLKPNMDLLDVGCGSGILSIIGAKLNAGKVFGTDIDPNAVFSAGENALVNKVEDRIEYISGDIISDKETQVKIGYESYDIAVANILADVIIPLSAVIGNHIKPEGLFISSGIINTKKEQVLTAILANGFEVLEVNEMGDWVSIVAKKAANI